MAKEQLGDLLVVDALSRIDGKLDKLDGRLDDHGQLMVKQQAILDEHVRRTDLLEKKVDAETAALKQGIPKAVEEEIRLTRNRYLLNIGKGILALAGTGVGVAAIKAALTWIVANWK